jgi:hypothetical protein
MTMTLLAEPVAGNKNLLTAFNAERDLVDHRITGANQAAAIYDDLHLRYGYLLCDDNEQNVRGIFSMIPYSEIGYPKPSFPTHWRPKSRFFYSSILAYRGSYNALAVLRTILIESRFGQMVEPITVTAELATEEGKRFFVDLCGADAIDAKSQHPMAAITFANRLDVYHLARDRVREGIHAERGEKNK